MYIQNTHGRKITLLPPNKNQEPADPTRILHCSNTFFPSSYFYTPAHNAGLCLEFASKGTSVRVAHCFVYILISLGNDISLGNIMCWCVWNNLWKGFLSRSHTGQDWRCPTTGSFCGVTCRGSSAQQARFLNARLHDGRYWPSHNQHLCLQTTNQNAAPASRNPYWSQFRTSSKAGHNRSLQITA